MKRMAIVLTGAACALIQPLQGDQAKWDSLREIQDIGRRGRERISRMADQMSAQMFNQALAAPRPGIAPMPNIAQQQQVAALMQALNECQQHIMWFNTYALQALQCNRAEYQFRLGRLQQIHGALCATFGQQPALQDLGALIAILQLALNQSQPAAAPGFF